MAKVELVEAIANSRFVVRHAFVDGKVRFYVHDTQTSHQASRLFTPGEFQTVWDRCVYLNTRDNAPNRFDRFKADTITYESAYGPFDG